jgi:hypothetical protein
MSKKTRWPKEVPVLEAGDICKERMDKGEQHCLLGWTYEVFGCDYSGCKIATTQTNAIIGDLEKACGGDVCMWGSPVAAFNDEKYRKKSTIAKVWNKVMAKRGYTEGNPEAKS